MKNALKGKFVKKFNTKNAFKLSVSPETHFLLIDMC